MSDVTILVCACGMRLRAAGAVPGRVGKCPACGGLLRVPEAPSPPAPKAGEGPDKAEADAENAAGGYTVGAAASTLRPSTYSASRRQERREPASAGGEHQLVRPPARPETRIRESLLYPLWGDSGLALLVLMPPIFWIGTIPLLTFLASGRGGQGLGLLLAALLSLLPSGLILLTAGSYTLLYLGRVLVTSALGEMHLPRWPEWDITEMLRGLGRWIWALLTGAAIGGLPTVAYWMYCGDIDLFDSIILVELAAVGAVYAQVALLASILHDDPLGANPITIVLAIWRAGWGCLSTSLLTGLYTVLAWAALPMVVEIETPLLAAVAYWLYWVLLLYGGMVVLRVLGLFYYRHARVLGWFRERPRWGA